MQALQNDSSESANLILNLYVRTFDRQCLLLRLLSLRIHLTYFFKEWISLQLEGEIKRWDLLHKSF